MRRNPAPGGESELLANKNPGHRKKLHKPSLQSGTETGRSIFSVDFSPCLRISVVNDCSLLLFFPIPRSVHVV